MIKHKQYISQQYKEAMKLRGKYTAPAISQKLSIHPWTLSNWFYQGYKPRCISNKWQKWNRARHTNLGELSQRKNYTLPKISQSKELAYIIGVYLGDGNSWNGFNLSAINQDFVKKTIDCLYTLFKIKLKIRKTQKNTQYRVRLFSRQFRDYLIKRTNNKKNIPPEIFRSSRDIKYAFFAGFFDSEGCVQYHNNALLFSLSQKGSKLLFQFKRLLFTLGITSRVRRDYKCYYKLFISHRNNLIHFYNKQLFMRRKQNKFNNIWRAKYG